MVFNQEIAPIWCIQEDTSHRFLLYRLTIFAYNTDSRLEDFFWSAGDFMSVCFCRKDCMA